MLPKLIVTLIIMLILSFPAVAAQREGDDALSSPLRNYLSGLAVNHINGRWRVMDTKGDTVASLPENVEFATLAAGGIIAAKFDKGWGLIGVDGQIIKGPTFARIEASSPAFGLMSIMINKPMPNGEVREMWGYANTRGEVIIEPAFDAVGPFSEGLAPVLVGRQWGYIDMTGTIQVRPAYVEAHEYYEGVAAVKVGRTWGFINHQGLFIIKPRFAEVQSFSEGLAAATGNPGPGGAWGFIDHNGDWVVQPNHRQATRFSCGLALVSAGKRYAYINRQGKTVLECDGGTPFFEGAAVIFDKGVFKIVDTRGDTLGIIDCDNATQLASGRAWATKGNVVSLVGSDGKTVKRFKLAK